MTASAARVARRYLRAAPAAALDPRKVYYHGTPSEKAGKSILRSGIAPPDLTTRQGPFRPVQGKVYLTPQIAYAMLYALGGEIAESFLRGRVRDQYPEHTWGGSEWGYLFVVPGRALTEVHPDEDSVGEMITEGTAPDWLMAMAQRVLKGKYPEARPPGVDHEDWTYFKSLSLYDHLVHYTYFQMMAQAEAGKLLLEEMTPAQELALITSGAHVAHEGTVIPTECWKIHKQKAPLLKLGGSNFFQVAERCR